MTSKQFFIAACFSFALAAPAFSQPAAAPPKPDAPAVARPAPIDRTAAVVLVRSALLALDQANKTGNYTVLRDLGAPAFRVNSAARLGEVFAPQRRDNVDLSSVGAADPQFAVAPQIEANGVMRITGAFPAATPPVSFDLQFAPIDNQWRLFGLTVNTGAAARNGAAADNKLPPINNTLSGAAVTRPSAPSQPAPKKK